MSNSVGGDEHNIPPNSSCEQTHFCVDRRSTTFGSELLVDQRYMSHKVERSDLCSPEMHARTDNMYTHSMSYTDQNYCARENQLNSTRALDTSTINSVMYQPHDLYDQSDHVSYCVNAGLCPHRREDSRNCTNIAADDYTDTASGKVDVDHAKEYNTCINHEGLYDQYTKEYHQEKACYIDDINIWDNNMDVHGGKGRTHERTHGVTMRGNVITDRTSSSSSRRVIPPIRGKKASCTMIEVAPGEYMRLRGAQETWEAVQQDFYIPGTCICCQETLFCIQDALFVLCPICDAVSPSQQGKILISDRYDGGVGLGFVIDELIQWQREIIASRNTGKS